MTAHSQIKAAAQVGIVVTGDAHDLCPPQHDEHTIGYRWHLYMQDQKQRLASMREEAARMIRRANDMKERRAAMFQQAAE